MNRHPRNNLRPRATTLLAWAVAAASAFTGLAEDRASPPPAQWTVIRAGWLLADPGSAAEPGPATFVVRDGLIELVVTGLVATSALEGVPAGALEIDLSKKFVLPGLIDCHTHITSEEWEPTMASAYAWSDGRWALQALPYLRRTLQAGFTTIRDVGGFTGAIYDLRRAVAQGLIPGPTIVAVREMLTPSGGHGDRGPLRPEISRPELLSVCDGPFDCRAKVRKILRGGADLVKIKVEGGVLSGTGLARDNRMFLDEIAEIVRTAHAENRKVAAHALSPGAVADALAAGVDSIEHGPVTAESLPLLKKSGAFFVPTLSAARAVAAVAGDPTGDAAQRHIAGLVAAADAGVRLAYQSGVLLAFGTDAGVIPHGSNAREFRYLVGAGVPPREALKMATVHAAELLGLSAEIGTIAAGKTADLIAVDANPLADITVLEKVSFVMKAGLVVGLSK